MTDPTLSPAALAVWEAFNSEEPGVFVDYGDCLAAALRATADQVVPETPSPSYPDDYESGAYEANQWARIWLLAIAAELDNYQPSK
jgi:hypothetical protein